MNQNLYRQATDQDLFQGAPNYIPYNPQVRVRQHMLQHVQQIMGVLIAAIQSNPNGSLPRLAMFWRMQHNQYNNSDFVSMLETTINYIDALAQQGQPYNPQQACTNIVSWYTGLETYLDNRIQQYLTQQQLADCQMLVNEFNNTGNLVQQIIGQQQQQQPMGGGGIHVGGGNAGGIMVSGHQSGAQGRVGSAFTNNSPLGVGTQRSSLSSALSGAGAHPETRQSSGSLINRPATMTSSTNTPSIPTTQAAATPNKGTAMQQQQPEYVQQLPQNDPEEYLGGIHPFAFNAANQVAFYRSKDNTWINYVVKAQESKVQYELHENQHLLRPRLDIQPMQLTNSNQDRQQKALIDKMKKELNADAFVVNPLGDLRFDVIRLPDYIGFIGNYHSSLDLYAQSMLTDQVLDLEAVGVMATFVHFDSITFGPELTSLIAEMTASTTTSLMGKRLKELRSRLSLPVWCSLDAKITSHLNEWLYRQAADTPIIISFSDNIDGLVDVLREDSPDILELLDTVFLEELQEQTLNFDTAEIYANIEGIDSSAPPIPPRPALFETVVLIPLVANQCDIALNGKMAAVSKQVLPELYEFLDKCHLFADKRTRRVRVMTLDNTSFFVFKGPNKNSFLIGRTTNFNAD